MYACNIDQMLTERQKEPLENDSVFKSDLNVLGFTQLKIFHFSEYKSLASDYKFLVDFRTSCTFCSTEYRI